MIQILMRKSQLENLELVSQNQELQQRLSNLQKQLEEKEGEIVYLQKENRELKKSSLIKVEIFKV